MKKLEYNLRTLILALLLMAFYAVVGLLFYLAWHVVYCFMKFELVEMSAELARGFMIVPAGIAGLLILTNIDDFKSDVVDATYEYEN